MMKLATCSFFLVLAACITGSPGLGQAPATEKKSVTAAAVVPTVHTSDELTVLRETQIGLNSKGYAGLVWWIPFEFWAHSAEEHGESAEKMREQMKALRDYTIVAVFAGKISPLASLDYVTPGDLQKKTFVRDSEGQEYAAFGDLTGDAKSLADLLHPIFANAMGRAGENFAILFFPAKTKAGKRIADEMSTGSFSVVLKNVVGETETVFLWRTPLTSFSAPRYCPMGGEPVHADWTYCPRHGVKLDQP
jgi:hypothetical protein